MKGIILTNKGLFKETSFRQEVCCWNVWHQMKIKICIMYVKKIFSFTSYYLLLENYEMVKLPNKIKAFIKKKKEITSYKLHKEFNIFKSSFIE